MVDYLETDEAAKHCQEKGLQIADKTLAKKRVTGGGPPFRKWGRKPVYTRPELDVWIEETLSAPMRSTSEAGRAPSRRGRPRKVRAADGAPAPALVAAPRE
jgi:hypothetical protein